MENVQHEEEAMSKRNCFTCNGTGVMCDFCGEASDACHCDDDGDSEVRDCDECLGTGIAFLDIEASDLIPSKLAEWDKVKAKEAAEVAKDKEKATRKKPKAKKS